MRVYNILGKLEPPKDVQHSHVSAVNPAAGERAALPTFRQAARPGGGGGVPHNTSNASGYSLEPTMPTTLHWLSHSGVFLSPACVACCRDQEVLSVFAAIIRRLKQSMEPEVPKVLAAVFEPTLQVCVVARLSQHCGSCSVRAQAGTGQHTGVPSNSRCGQPHPSGPAFTVLNTCPHSSCVYSGECIGCVVTPLLPLHTCR